MEYNTQRKKLPLPEYGRSVQNMVDHALTIKDRQERQRCANTIIAVMGSLFPEMSEQPDFKHKLWDHLAIMSDFKLDIDYPFEVVKEESLKRQPDPMPYTQNGIRFRHYGHLLESLIQKAVKYPEGDEKYQLVRMIANYMKRSYFIWNKDGVDDQKILDDLRLYSKGAFNFSADDLILEDIHHVESSENQQKTSKKKKKRNKS